MGVILSRLAWSTAISCVVAYAAYIVLGSMLQADAEEASRAIVVRDVLQPGAHHLSGIVMVPSTCADLIVRTEQLSDTSYGLAFDTWEQPSLSCERESAARSFNTVVFAPAAGINFSATMQGKPLRITVIQAIHD